MPRSAGTVHGSLSERRLRLHQIEQRRAGAHLSTVSLSSAAGVGRQTYLDALAGRAIPRPGTLFRLEMALASLLAERRAAAPDTLLIRATYGGFVLAVAERLGVRPTDVHAQDPRRGATADPEWRRLAQVRQAAIYLTNVALGVKQSRLADALGLTPAAICLGLRSVEGRREDPAFDRMLEEIGAAVAAAIEGGL
jgi:hypothetical protein